MAYNPMNYLPQYQTPYYQQPVPTTRAVEAIPVDNENQVLTWPVNVGATVLFMSKDDSFVAFKTNTMKGEDAPVFYDKRPPLPPQPAFDPSAYVTRDELEKRLMAFQKEADA